jgi:hypothetical protein
MASSTRKTILVIARELDESELRCSTLRTVPENILPELPKARKDTGSSSVEGKSLAELDSGRSLGASAA